MSSNKTFRQLTDTKALLLFTFWSFLVQLFLSNDSPFFGLTHHVDSAWFYMEGKAFIIGSVAARLLRSLCRNILAVL